MIELTDLNEKSFVLNCDLIETIVSIPETKIALVSGKYYLVSETPDQVIGKVVKYNREIRSKNISKAII
jgi:flagellar protein FlbD